MSKFSRRQYEEAAQWLKADAPILGAATHRNIALVLAAFFERDNPRFRRFQFLHAAGVLEGVPTTDDHPQAN